MKKVLIIFISLIACLFMTIQAHASLLFTDTANRPANIFPDTVITTSNNGMWVVTEGEYSSFNQDTEEIYAYQDGPDIIISFALSGISVKVIQMPDPTPVISSATRPATIEPGTIIVLSNGQTWKVISETYYSMNAATQDVIVYKYGSVYKMSFQGCGAAMQVEKISVLFSDTANRPANIFPDTVITTSDNGMWVVTTESEYYSFNPDTEEIYAYQDGLDIRISFALSGISVKVIQMPDPTPVISSATRPASIEPGTIIVLSNGQTWKVTSGSFSSFTSETEDVVLYKYGSVYRMSFQASGVTMQVELLSDGAYYTLKLSKSGTGFGDVTGPGISCGNNCVESYVSGTNITLNASPASGSLFTSWVEGGQEISTKSKYTFTITADRNLVANFSAIQDTCNILILAEPSNGGIISGDGLYSYGAQVTVTAIPAKGFVFQNWTENGLVVSNNAEYNFIADRDRTLVAHFRKVVLPGVLMLLLEDE